MVLDPYNPLTNSNDYGKKQLRKDAQVFFLKPGETLENGVQDIIVLEESSALLLIATEDCEDSQGKHKAGERWMVQGPGDYIPPVGSKIVETRKAMPLDKNEGIYIRNIETG